MICTKTEALTYLRAGKLVAIPTETVYGLAAPIDQVKAIDEVFQLKKRPHFDPLIVHISDFSQLKYIVAEIPPIALALAEEFWPGPLTLVLPKHKTLNTKITSGLNTVGVRMPKHAETLSLIQELGVPLAAPSANPFGQVSPSKAEHVESYFPELPVLNGGPCEGGIESTVLGVKEDQLIVHRPGLILKEDLETFLHHTHFSHYKITAAPSEASPGQVKHHYMPRVPLVILKPNSTPKDVQNPDSSVEMCLQNPAQVELPEDPVLAARELYEELRRKSKTGITGLWFSPTQRQLQSDWTPIWDRLHRAASFAY